MTIRLLSIIGYSVLEFCSYTILSLNFVHILSLNFVHTLTNFKQVRDRQVTVTHIHVNPKTFNKVLTLLYKKIFVFGNHLLFYHSSFQVRI
jgi:hypothetical protein